MVKTYGIAATFSNKSLEAFCDVNRFQAEEYDQAQRLTLFDLS
jgi:hypothetical protein